MGYKFTFGIEDKPKFHSEVAIFSESIVEYLGEDDEICAVICNNDEELSNDLKKIGEVYEGKLRFLFPINIAGHKIEWKMMLSLPIK